MSANASSLTVEMNAELQKIIAEATSPEAIRAAIQAEAEKQLVAKTDSEAQKTAAEKAAADKAAEEARVAAAEQKFTRVVTINGRDFEFEAATEIELANLINNAYQLAEGLRPEPGTQTAVPAVDQAAVAKAAADKAAADAAARADLDLKFKRGEISTTEYLTKSGAVDEYLAAKGISVDAIKKTVETTESTQYEKSWAQATEEFLKSAEGADWPGGDQNREILGMKLIALDLTDAQDKVSAIKQAYASMKQSHLVVPATAAASEDVAAKAAAEAAARAAAGAGTKTNAELAAEKAVHDAEVAAAALAAQRLAAPIPSATRASSSLFGASSGISSQAAPAATGVNAAKVEIPANATPAEILEAWKAAQIGAGVNPNDAFMDTFRSRRA